MSKGRFGVHGGQYMPETLMNAVIELEAAYNHYKDDPEFNAELTELLNGNGKELSDEVRAFAEELKELEEGYEDRLKKLL